MAFDWEHVEAIRAEQDSARNRRDLNTLPTNEVSNEIYNSPSGRSAKIPGLDHWEQMIHKVRTQLIDYIIEHGLVQGFEYDGINEPIKNGKIVITAEMLQRVTDRFGYFKEKETLEFVEKYLPEHHYVTDENYVHTDNNYTDAEKAKLEGIADGAEVNKIISVLFNGVEAIDTETRIATITITPADVKEWYEQNPNTNVFTDAEKVKLESINIDELSNKVEDVTLDGETIVKNKVAALTAKKIKNSYESNADTNAFTDADKALVEHVLPEIQKSVNQHEQRIDTLEKSQITQDAEIEGAKNSITELGNEVNSVAGRVTTLETSQRTQDEEISNLKAKDAAQDGRIDALEASEATQNADILQLKADVKNAGKVDDVTVGGVSVVENKVAKIPAIPKSNVIINHIALNGLNGQTNIESDNEYDMMIVIDENTPLPPNKFIGITFGFSASENDLTTYPDMKGMIGLLNYDITTDSSSSGTHIMGFTSKVYCKAIATNSSGAVNMPVNTFSSASLYVNIVTDGIELLIDKAQSAINKEGTS